MADDMRWWGWGDPAHRSGLPEHAVELLRTEVGVADDLRPPVDLEDVRLPPSRLDANVRAAMVAVAGDDGLRDDQAARVLRAAGKSYPDLVLMRRGRPDGAPDAVLLPASHEQVVALLGVCAGHDVAVVPFGGGTSVVGGVAPLAGNHAAVVALDLRRLAGLAAVDRRSLTARFGAGTRGPALEQALADHDLTLGHFPQSFEYVTVGGCAATRSAGQASTGYGRFDKLVRGLRMATPTAELGAQPFPATAAGPDLRQLVVGSEGTLGVITDVTLEVRPRPAERRYEGLFFESFAAGAEAMRDAVQDDAGPDVARLSDEDETRLTMALAGDGGLKGALGRRYLQMRGYAGGCLAIVGWEASAEALPRRRARSLERLTAAGGIRLGASPGRAWAAGRFHGPYLRDDLLDRGVMVETLETATDWTRLAGLRLAVADALRETLAARETPALVMCHVSHLYATGASLYFTFIARQQDGQELEQWRAAKTAACEAIVAGGGTITHHHAVGRDHAPWLEREIGARGLAVLRALKTEFDPAGIMNPGKLLV